MHVIDVFCILERANLQFLPKDTIRKVYTHKSMKTQIRNWKTCYREVAILYRRRQNRRKVVEVGKEQQCFTAYGSSNRQIHGQDVLQHCVKCRETRSNAERERDEGRSVINGGRDRINLNRFCLNGFLKTKLYKKETYATNCVFFFSV